MTDSQANKRDPDAATSSDQKSLSVSDSNDGRTQIQPHGEPMDRPSAQVPDTARTIGGWMMAALWLMAILAGTYAAQGWLDGRAQRRDGITVYDSEGRESLKISADRYGQFTVAGSANAVPVQFLVDTGASGISIPAELALRAGLKRGRPFPASTANGVTTVYATTIDTLQIGPFRHQRVNAHINPSMDGDMALLGMSFLRDFELIQRDGVLIINTP